MQEIETLGYKLLIQPLYVQFFVHAVTLSLLTSLIDNVFFASTIPFGIKFFECLYYGLAVTAATTFSHRTSYGRVKKDAHLKHWIDFQCAVRTSRHPKREESIKALTWFIREAKGQSKRRRLYGPLMLMLGGVANVLISSWQDENYFLPFAIVMSILGLVLFYEAKREFDNLKALAVKQQLNI